MPGYDLVATNPEQNRSLKIQVKSRWSTAASGFPIKNFNCDFVVFCRLNRGKKGGKGVVKDPEYFVFPVAVVKKAQNTDSVWGKVYIRDIPKADTYRNRWDLIAAALVSPATARSRSRPA